MKGIIFTILLSALINNALSYSSGAPVAVCDDMTPKHPFSPQTSPIPYQVIPSKSTVAPGEEIDLVISGQKPFKGFLLQVRNGDQAVGSFLIPDNDRSAKAIDCHSGKGSAATHKNADDKKELKLKWKAPSTTGGLTIYVTVAETGEVFWAKKPVGAITVS